MGSHIRPIAHLDTFAFAASLYARMKSFDDCTLRQNAPGSPHRDTRSIFLRGPETDGIPDDALIPRWFEDVPHVDYPLLEEWPEARSLISKALWALPEFPLGVREDQLGKAMVIELKSGGALAWHRDEGRYAEATSRFHVAIATNPQAFLYSGGEQAHLPVGVLAQFDTSVLHSAVNHGPRPRYHCVIDVRRT